MNEKEFQGFMEKASLATMTDTSGNKTNLTASDLTKMGLVNKIPAQGAVPYYKTDAGITLTAPADRMSITLDESTGNIKIRAPKSITDLPEFKQTFDEDTFKAYSLAYKLNPDYKVTVEEKNKDTGEVEEKSVTIPEWVQNRDSALKVFVANVNAAEEKRKILMRKYGEKAKNMTLTNIAMSEQSGKYTYLPEILKGVSVFGDDPNKKNPFKQILDKLGEDGEISEEDLKEVYTRGNFGRTELAGVLATIDGYLKGSNWSSDEYYTDADTGEKVYNTTSAKEAAKLLAFRDFLISHHPEGNWFEEMGGNIETLSLNVLYGADRVFMNIANLGEAAFTWGQSTAVQNYIKGMDQTIGQYNQDKALESEATQVLATLGYIGGTILGSRLVGALGGAIASDISQHIQSALAGAPSLGPSAMAALTEESIAGIYAASENYVRGAWIAMKYASIQQKVAIAKGIYEGFMNKHGVLDFATSVLIDTFHDALLYDSTSLRDVIANSDGNTAGFWLSQFTDNTKWWTGMALGKGVIKVTGKTAWGKAANIRATKLVNKVASKIGDFKTSLKDKVYGGDVVKRLEEKIEEAVKKNELKKANRLKNQKKQEEWNVQLREARKDLGNLSLEWDGIKLTAESEEAYKNAVGRIKALENAIDSYDRNIEYQRQLMVGAQYDPSTGKTTFINPSLGEANLRATEWYVKLTDLNKKYNLPLLDERSLLNQDVINYWMGKYEYELATEVAKGTTEKAKQAKEALETLEANIAVAGAKLPKEITDFIDEGVEGKIYQSWYAAQNEYGMAKGILNRAKATSYEENPIYKEVGYQPIVREREASRGRYVDKEGKLNAKIDKEFDEIEFKVEPEQNYVDPELVRQSRLSEMAQIEVNNQMFKAYSGFGSNATNVTKVSGEETEYVRQVDSGKKYLETEVAQASVEKLKELKIPITKVRRRKPIKNIIVPEKDMATIVASMSQDEVAEYLVRHKLMKTGETISGNVSEANYTEWFNSQNNSTKKFLIQQYNDYGLEEIKNGTLDAETRTKLAQEVVDKSNGEKLLAWRSQGTGVDDFYGSAGGNGASSDAERAKWEGGRWTSIGGEPWSIGGYGNQKLAFPVNKSDLLSSYDMDEYVSTAEELYTLKYGDKFQKQALQMVYKDSDQKIEDLLHYDEISKLKKADLKKIADGDPRALLDISGKKIINYDGIAGREWVIFPDRNPELLEDGLSEMQSARGLEETASTRFNLFKRAYEEGGADFEANLQRATLRGDEGFSKSSLANEAKHNISMGKEAFYQGVLVAEVKSRLRNVKNIDTTPLVDNMVESFTGYIDDFVDAVLDDGGAKSAINALSETTDASYDFGRYIALRRLHTSGNMKAAHKQIDELVDKARSDIKGLDAKDVDVLKHQLHELFDDIVETELDSVSQVVRTTNPDIVNAKSIYDKADELNKKITAYDDEIKSKGDTNTVMYLDDEGRQVFAEVDPAFASLFNYRYQIDKTEASALAKINAATSKIFRYGTTSVNLASFGNQLFRDFGNALMVGGSWHTIKFYRNQLVDVFGKNIVDQIGRFDPSGYEMKQLEQVAKANGQTLQEAAVSRELMRGAAISPTTTETTLYKKIIKSAYGGDTETTLRDMRNKFQKFVDEHNLDDLLNGKRENYLRNRVYASSFAEAMNSGYTLEQSRVWAEFAMNNATTNFSRQLYHLQAIADSTPYFRAAINGTKSFWRMWSLDPVGISGRITGGLIIPVMYMTGASLGTEENRKVYESIPEYQKAESFVFVVNGQIVSAPMPQELATIVAPFRQFVEYLYGSNKNDFWELMMNDALGFFPYDLQGFSTIDMDKMIEDPTILDRMNRGVSRVFSQLAPIPVKTAYMLATGTDPYSGKNLRNPQYSWWNEETNSVETQDYNQNSFAKVVASIPFIKDWVTPELAEKVVSGVIGTTGSHLLGDITALVTEGGEKAFTETMTNIGSQLTKPFTIAKYDLTDAIWRRAVKELTAEKEVILNSDDMQTINSKLSQEKDPEKRKALLAKRQTLVDSYQQKVGGTVKRLESEYNGTFDYSKFSAVIQLLNFNTNAPYQNASQYSSDLATSLYYEGRDAAIHTMQALGIDGTHDTSVFGYLTKDKDGNVVMKYSNPVAILDMTNTWSNQKDYHLANIKALASQNNLWDKKDAVDNQIDAIYAKGKLSNSDYDAIDAIYVNWNAEVMSALAPYVQDMTPEAAINNQQVLNYLSGLIEVPGDYKKDKYGKYVTNSKLGNGSATQAYIRNYIKNIFKINDTAYSSGKNYSTRKQYDEKEKRWK